MIQIAHLTFDYPGLRALHDISVDIPRGSVTALVGSNGAGKTTLLRCIAGLDAPLAGSISVAGVPVQDQPRAVHRLLGYLSDSFGLYQDLTVAQCLHYAAAAQGLPASTIAAAVADTAQKLALTDRLAQRCGGLSRGLRQRVAIGQAIIHAPQVLLLDEPASGLDPEARGELARLFRELQAGGMTLLVSSHILAELDEYSTHMLVLRAGRVLEHRPLQAAAAPSRRTLQLTLAIPDTGLAQRLAADARIAVASCSDDAAQFTFCGSQVEQASLLACLIGDGLAVASLAEHKENLQQSYLRSLENPNRSEAQQGAAA